MEFGLKLLAGTVIIGMWTTWACLTIAFLPKWTRTDTYFCIFTLFATIATTLSFVNLLLIP